MKLYGTDDIGGYSLTHPRGYDKALMKIYYSMTCYRNTSFVTMNKRDLLSISPFVYTSYDGSIHVDVVLKSKYSMLYDKGYDFNIQSRNLIRMTSSRAFDRGFHHFNHRMYRKLEVKL